MGDDQADWDLQWKKIADGRADWYLISNWRDVLILIWKQLKNFGILNVEDDSSVDVKILQDRRKEDEKNQIVIK